MAAGLVKEEGRFERTAPLLKQNQLQEMKSEVDRLSSTLRAPPHLRNAIQDSATMFSTLKRVEQTMNRDTPRAYEGTDIDTAVRREKTLREQIVSGMPTFEEMRRQPPGALDKHMNWEGRNKANIAEWKNIRRRLWAGGHVSQDVADHSVANVEMFRPRGGAGELSMDNAVIPVTKTYTGLGGRSVPFSDEQLAFLAKFFPGIHSQLPLMSADQRDEVKAVMSESALAPVAVSTDDIDTLNHKDLRDRCRAAGIETGGSRDDLLARLKAHYEGN